MITHIDDEVGKIIKTLEDRGELEDTIVIFAADNGLALGQHGLFGKQCHYEHSIRVPFIMAGPGIPENRKKDDYIYILDVFPTLCDLSQIDIPETVEGKSFAKGIVGKPYDKREDLYFAYTDKIRSVKNSQYKLMQHVYAGKVTRQLFDIIKDPLEMCNLIEQNEYANVIEELDEKLVSYRDQWNDNKHPLGMNYWNQLEHIKG